MLKHKLTTIVLALASLFSAAPAFATTTKNMLCPSANLTVVAKSGNSYTTNTQSNAVNVSSTDINSLIGSGCLPYAPATVYAATDPTSAADNTEGFTIGSTWVNSTGPKVWIATAVGTGAATWTQTGNSITSGTNLQAGASGTAGEVDVYPTTAASGKLALTAVDNTGNYTSTLTNSNIGQATTYSLPECGNATCNVVTSKGTQTISGNLTFSGTNVQSGTLASTGVTTYGAAGGIVASTATSTVDIAPPFDNRILGNPIAKVVSGTCTVAAVNGGTCIPLADAASRTITVTHFDIVAAGSAATCTGIFLEDTNGTPVVIATLAAATLTSGAHNVPLAATLGVGFGAGSGLTTGKGVQIIKNGSDCGTTTAFKYTINYAIQ